MAVVVLFLLPEGEVLFEQLNDALGVAEVIFFKLVDLVKGRLQGSVGKITGLSMILHDFVVEDGEVQGEAELDRVTGSKFDFVGVLVAAQGLLLGLLELVTFGVLADIAVVVAFHLDEEGLCRAFALGILQDFGLGDVDDALAIFNQLLLDSALVGKQSVQVLGILGILLDG